MMPANLHPTPEVTCRVVRQSIAGAAAPLLLLLLLLVRAGGGLCVCEHGVET